MSRVAWKWAVIAALLLFGVASRFANIGAQGIRVDETWVVPTPNFHFYERSIYPKLFEFDQFKSLPHRVQTTLKTLYEAHPIIQIVAIRAASDVHPPVFFVFNYYWSKIFGYGITSIRIPAAIYFIVTLVLLMLFLTRQQLGYSVVFISMLLLVTSPYYLFLSNYARPYTLMMLLGLWSSYQVYMLSANGISIRGIIAYGLVCIAFLYTHYYAVFVVAAQAGYTVFESSRRNTLRKDLRSLCALYAGIGLAFAPWVGVILFQAKMRYPGIESVGGFRYFDAKAISEMILFFGPAYSRSTVNTPMNMFFSMLEFVFVLVGLARLWRTRDEPASRFWLFFLVVPLVLAGMVNVVKPVFSVRNFGIIMIPYFVAAAFGLSSIKRKVVRACSLAAIGGMGLYFASYGLAYQDVKGRLALEDWPAVARFIQEKYAREQPVVYVYHSSFRDALYYYIPEEQRVRGLEDAATEDGPREERFLLVLMNHGLEPNEQKVRNKVPFLAKTDRYEVALEGEFSGAYIYRVGRKES